MLKPMACAALLFAAAGPAQAAPVILTISVPSPMVMPTHGKIEARIGLTLTNTAAAPVELSASNKCAIGLWSASDAQGEEVDGRTICPMIYMPQSHTLPPGDWQSDAILAMDAAKFANGGHYKLHYRFWGVPADAVFTVRKR